MQPVGGQGLSNITVFGRTVALPQTSPFQNSTSGYRQSTPQFNKIRLRGSYHVVDEVGESPHHRDADERDAEQDDMQQPDAQDIREPYATTVHHLRVGVDLAVSRAHVHGSHTKSRHLLAHTS